MFRFAGCTILLIAFQQLSLGDDQATSPSLGDPDLVGLYRITSIEGPKAPTNRKGFAAITRVVGLLSNEDGTAPTPFKFRTARQGGRNLIDITIGGDHELILYGIYEISGDTVRMCWVPVDPNSIHQRPESFRTADPKYVTKLTLKRVSKAANR